MREPKLRRSLTDRLLGGVCGGLSRYLGIGAVWWRLAFVVATVLGSGLGAVIYLILWFLTPEETLRDLPPLELDSPDNMRESTLAPIRVRVVAGLIVIGIGALTLAYQLGAAGVSPELLLPVAGISVGGAWLFNRWKGI